MKTILLGISVMALAIGCAPIVIVEAESAISPDCGNGLQDAGEFCDDGNNNSGDGCRRDCLKVELCGDSILDEGEACDDGEAASGDGCRADCQGFEECGDGLLDVYEQCDDGNNNSGDGCTANCQSDEYCGSGVVDPGEGCDDGNGTEGDGCDTNCTESGCGNDVLDDEVCLANVLPIQTILGVNATSSAVADLDNDGDLDIATISRGAIDVDLLINDGTGHFTTQTTNIGNLSGGINHIEAVDLGNDGLPELILNDTAYTVINGLASGRVHTIKNHGIINGSLTFSHHATNSYPDAYLSLNDTIALADLNGDGRKDLLVPFMYFNNTALVSAVQLFRNQGGTFFLVEEIQISILNEDIRDLVLKDFDNDGDDDLVVLFDGVLGTHLEFFTNNGFFQFSSRGNFSLGEGAIDTIAITAADLDIDGDQDLAILGSDVLNSGMLSKVFFLENIGGFGFNTISSINFTTTKNHMAFADLNQDGVMELAVSNDTQLDIFGASFSPFIFNTVLLSVYTGDGTSDLDVGDLNNDNLPDLIDTAKNRPEVGVILTNP